MKVVLPLLFCIAIPAAGHAGKDFDKLVRVTAKASKVGTDGKQTVAFTFAIDKGWYIYANPVGDKDYEDNHTTIDISAKDKVKAEVQYPNATSINKHKHRIYETEVVIKSDVQRAPGDRSPLQATIVINVCNHKDTCLPPRTIKLTIP